jgi:hypothetical protein
VFKLDGMQTVAVASNVKPQRAAAAHRLIKPLARKPSTVRIAAGNSAHAKKVPSAPSGTNEEWEEF